MALYTQKFIAADYLAKVQTQTHFFLRPLVGRAVRNGEREEWTKGVGMRKPAKLERREERNTQLGRMKRKYSERESGKLRRWVRVVELSAYSSPLSLLSLVRLCHSEFSTFESRGNRGFLGKDVHRFLLSDRPFEQQPTWQSEPYYA